MRKIIFALFILFLFSCTEFENEKTQYESCECGDTKYIRFIVNNGLGFLQHEDYHGVIGIKQLPYNSSIEEKWEITICQYWDHCRIYKKIVYADEIEVYRPD